MDGAPIVPRELCYEYIHTYIFVTFLICTPGSLPSHPAGQRFPPTQREGSYTHARKRFLHGRTSRTAELADVAQNPRLATMIVTGPKSAAAAKAREERARRPVRNSAAAPRSPPRVPARAASTTDERVGGSDEDPSPPRRGAQNLDDESDPSESEVPGPVQLQRRLFGS